MSDEMERYLKTLSELRNENVVLSEGIEFLRKSNQDYRESREAAWAENERLREALRIIGTMDEDASGIEWGCMDDYFAHREAMRFVAGRALAAEKRTGER